MIILMLFFSPLKRQPKNIARIITPDLSPSDNRIFSKIRQNLVLFPQIVDFMLSRVQEFFV